MKLFIVIAYDDYDDFLEMKLKGVKPDFSWILVQKLVSSPIFSFFLNTYTIVATFSLLLQCIIVKIILKPCAFNLEF